MRIATSLRACIAGVGIVLGCSTVAVGDLVTTGNLPITVSGQNTVVAATAPNLWGAGTGTLTFDAMGDFDDLAPSEVVDLYLDNIFIGTAGRGLPGSIFTPGSQPGMAGLHRLQATFTVSAAVMQTILGSDTALSFRLDNSSNVGGTVGFTGDYVSASLAYSSVPEPASIALVAVAGAGFWVRRRCRRSR